MGPLSRMAESHGVRERLDMALERGALESKCQSLTVGGVDGLVIAHRLPQDHDPRLSAALAAAIVGVANSVARELRRGGVQRVVVECDSGSVLCLAAGPNAVLIGLCNARADVTLAKEGLARVAGEIATIIAEV